MTPTTKLKAGEYLYEKGDFAKRIKRDAYMGGWDIYAVDCVGAPPFALGFTTKSDAVRWLDEQLEKIEAAA